jgi:DNA-directed RNA polymerase subunit RPC12/RpoP
MDIIFNCPKCEQELEVDSSGAGSEIDCPSCGETILIPQPGTQGTRMSADAEAPGHVPDHAAGANPINPIATSAAAKIEMHLKVPVHTTPTESLIAKALPPLEVAAKESDKKIRIKTIRHTDCIEVGHDRFDEIVSQFLGKVGDTNIVSINSINYTFLDIGTQKLMTEYGVMVVYEG